MIATLRISIAIEYSRLQLYEATSHVSRSCLSRAYFRLAGEIRFSGNRRSRGRRISRWIEETHLEAAIAQHVGEARLVVGLHVGLLRLHVPGIDEIDQRVVQRHHADALRRL